MSHRSVAQKIHITRDQSLALPTTAPNQSQFPHPPPDAAAFACAPTSPSSPPPRPIHCHSARSALLPLSYLNVHFVIGSTHPVGRTNRFFTLLRGAGGFCYDCCPRFRQRLRFCTALRYFYLRLGAVGGDCIALDLIGF